MAPRTSKRLRRALGGALIAAAAPSTFTGQAQAAGSFTYGAEWTGSNWKQNPEGALRAGAFRTTDPNSMAGIAGPNVAFNSGDWASKDYCGHFGANTRITQAKVSYTRYHSSALTGYVRVLTPGGETYRIADSAITPTLVHDRYVPINTTAGQCFSMQFLVTGNTVGGSPMWHSRLSEVTVQDLEDAAIHSFSVQPGWLSGPTAQVYYNTSDNDFRLGSVWLAVPGNGWGGDSGNQRGAQERTISIAGLPDGAHEVRMARTGSSGGEEASAATTVYVDQNAPGVPGVNASGGTAQWTNQNVTVSAPATGDGTGSGWNVNYLYNGGGHIGNNSATLTTDGVHQITARAQDNAGHVSGHGATTTVRIDKTAPVARIGQIDTVSPGVVNINANPTDNLSGIASVEARLGSASGPVLGDSVADMKTLGASGPARNTGMNRVFLRVTDQAGNTDTAQSAPIRFDSVAPQATITQAPSGWIKNFNGDRRLGVTLTDNLPDGVGEVVVQAQQGQGAWTTLQSYNTEGNPAVSQGAQLLSPSLDSLGVRDGEANVRVIARDPASASLQTISPATTVQFDVTSPTVTNASLVKVTAEGAGVFRLTVPGISDSASGLGSVRVQAVKDGRAVTVGETLNPSGIATVTADLSAFGDQTLYPTLITVTDKAGNATTFSGPSLSLDQDAPSIGAITIDPGTGRIQLPITDGGGLGACPVSVSIQGPGTGGQPRTVYEAPAGTLPGGLLDFMLPMQGLANGDYDVQIAVCDAAGNVTSRTSRFNWTGGPNGGAGVGGTVTGGNNSNANRPDLTDARIGPSISPQASEYRIINGMRVPVIKGVYGKKYVIRGQVTDLGDKGLAGIVVSLRDPSGKHIAGTRTNAKGQYTINAKALRGGLHQVVAIGNPERKAAVLLQVVPKVTAKMKMRATPNGARTLTVTGTLLPKAGSYGKRVQLQWRDGKRWRPVADGTVTRKGAYRLTYSFRKAGGYKVQMRVLVPTEKGWPYLAGTTKKIVVKVAR